MNGAQIRASFLEYFAQRGHAVVESSALIPRNDPSLFFTNSGMVQFKNVFTGEEKRGYSRATTVQKCLRVSGKHNDLENVGFTPRHHTFFEMLGNFSFGDYFKKDAIDFAWKLLTEVYKLDGEKLWITIFRDDDEAFELWRDTQHIPERRIVRLGEKDNFWAMGDTGPCGPCSEIHIDKQAFAGKGVNPLGIEADPEGYLEIWNLVFMQYERSGSGVLSPLPRPSIDTGMGLERLASVLQGVSANYDTDLFQPIIQRVAGLSGIPYGKADATDTSMRVIADHARATAFLICDGIMPSNEDRGYVLRRIMRRAIRHGVKLGLKEGFLEKAVGSVVEEMNPAFPELVSRQSYLSEVVLAEEEQFARTLEKGLRLYRDQAESLRAQGSQQLPGEFAFRLSDTYGFPLDLTQVIADEDGLTVDEEGYQRELTKQRELARKAWRGSGEEGIGAVWQQLRNAGHRTEFLGYETLTADATVIALVRDGARVSEVQAGERFELVTDRTPFYGESGGQQGDCGTAHKVHPAIVIRLELPDAEARLEITDTQKPVDGVFVHKALVLEGRLKEGELLHLVVDAQRRAAIRRNHTATHLLHAALRGVLGPHVAQRGSLVAPDRLRFDFSHFKPMSSDEIRQVEDLVNEGVLQNTALQIRWCGLQEAMSEGVMALFGEKYGEEVRVVSVPGQSAELCGGTHVQATGDIGAFKLVSESGIQSGVRRIEAVTGLGALELMRTQDDRFRQLGDLLKVAPGDLANRVQRLLDEKRELEKVVDELKRKLARGGSGTSVESRTRVIGGIKVVSMAIELDDPKALREEADRLRSTLGSAVVALGATTQDGRATLLVALTKDLTNKLSAGNLVKEAARLIEGSGGGKAELAQAGGKNPARLPEALDHIYALVAQTLGVTQA